MSLWVEVCNYNSDDAFISTMIAVAVMLCALLFLLLGWVFRRIPREGCADPIAKLTAAKNRDLST
jgi:hypothetical protein